MNDVVYELLISLNGIATTDYVLEYKGRPAKCVKRAFEKACAKAGLEDVTRYTLRHTFANQLFEQGVTEKVIADLMGHTTAQTTQRHYIKTNMSMMREAMNAVALTAQKQRKSLEEEMAPDEQTEGGSGAAYRIRTYDLIITNDALYQLS